MLRPDRKAAPTGKNRKRPRLNSSLTELSYPDFCLNSTSPGLPRANCLDASPHWSSGRLHFFFNDTAPTEIYTLSLHDALPICRCNRDCYRPPRETCRCWSRESSPPPPKD